MAAERLSGRMKNLREYGPTVGKHRLEEIIQRPIPFVQRGQATSRAVAGTPPPPQHCTRVSRLVERRFRSYLLR